MRLLKAAFLCSVLAITGGRAAAAELPAGADGGAPLWAKRCGKDGDGRELCYVEQYAMAMPANTMLLNVMIGFVGPEGKPRMIMTAPLGIMLMPGLVMTVDSGKPLTLPLESCQPGGCRTVADLDPSGLDQLRRGTRMTVRFVTGDGKALDIPVPLTGLDAALKQLKR